MRMQSGLASVCALVAVLGTDVLAEEFASPRLRDRGQGLPTSMFNTFIDRGEWLVYTFVEAYFDSDMEYKPAELGHTLDQDFRGEYTAIEELVFLAYGLNDWLAVEIEAAVIHAELQKNSDDTSSMPEKLRGSATSRDSCAGATPLRATSDRSSSATSSASALRRTRVL
jgi:hypothetical protein